MTDVIARATMPPSLAVIRRTLAARIKVLTRIAGSSSRAASAISRTAADPAARGRGLQTALLARRWQKAGAASADIVCSGAPFLSASHRNMERLGMRIQCTRALCTECPTTS